jgi:hypothetical protein
MSNDAPANREDTIQQLMTTLRQRWGENALQRLADVRSTDSQQSLPTSWTVLDAATGLNGLPRGHLTECLGQPTSGMTTFAHKVIASAQAENDIAAYIDSDQTVDPHYATRCGVNLDALLLVQPEDAKHALAIARDLITTGVIGLLVLDMGARHSTASFRRLVPALTNSASAMLVLATTSVCEQASLRLRFTREAWITNGYRVIVSIEKNKFAPPHPPVTFDLIPCDGGSNAGGNNADNGTGSTR